MIKPKMTPSNMSRVARVSRLSLVLLRAAPAASPSARLKRTRVGCPMRASTGSTCLSARTSSTPSGNVSMSSSTAYCPGPGSGTDTNPVASDVARPISSPIDSISRLTITASYTTMSAPSTGSRSEPSSGFASRIVSTASPPDCAETDAAGSSPSTPITHRSAPTRLRLRRPAAWDVDIAAGA